MTFKPPSVLVNVGSMSQQEMEQYVIDEIRKRIENHFVGEVLSSQSIHGIEAMFRSALKDMERTGVIRQPLTEQDIKGISEIMLLEWNIPNYEGPSHYDPALKARVTPVSAPDVRAICGALSDQALKAMTAPYEDFGDCENTARFFFLEKLRREGAILDWSFRWTNPQTRSGDLTITPKHDIKFVSVSGLVDV